MRKLFAIVVLIIGIIAFFGCFSVGADEGFVAGLGLFILSAILIYGGIQVLKAD